MKRIFGKRATLVRIYILWSFYYFISNPDIQPKTIHDRSQVFIGAKEEIEELTKYLNQEIAWFIKIISR